MDHGELLEEEEEEGDMAGNSMRSRKKEPEIRSNGVEEQIDRLSDLPDNIIDHILSFLDSKSVVQTSLLSRRWRCLWKAVPTLNFYGKCFHKRSSFIEHVNKFLSLRFDHVAVGSIAFDFGRDFYGKTAVDLFHNVMQHAAAVRGGQLHHLSISLSSGEFNNIATPIAACDHHESLKILKLKGLDIYGPPLSSLGFKMLTTLELDSCHLWQPSFTLQSGTVEVLANLPTCLNYLKLLDCRSLHLVKVSAPQLLDLEIKSSHFSEGIEVSAPKLKSVRVWDNMLDLASTPYKFNFPSLDHASIRVCRSYNLSYWYQEENTILDDSSRAYMDLLRGLHNVESLNLRFDKSECPWEEHLYPFSRMKPLIESSELSAFTRLKMLRVQYPEDPPIVPYEVIRYFFESSSSTGEKSVKFEKIK